MLTFRSTFRLAICAAAVLWATACAGSPSGPGVASLGGGATRTTSASATPGNDFNKFLAFSACMRSHGIKDFPDPQQGSGGISGDKGIAGAASKNDDAADSWREELSVANLAAPPPK